MGIKSSRPGGADAGRGDDPYANDWQTPGKAHYEARVGKAKQLGIPHAWVGKDFDIGFSGNVVGYPDAKHITLSAESTGGGESDSHTVPFAHGFDDSPKGRAGFNSVYKGNVRMRGREGPGGLSWTLHPGDK